MIWQLGALTAIAEDPDLVSGTHMGGSESQVKKDKAPLSSPCGHQANMPCNYTYAGKTLIQTKILTDLTIN